MQKDIWTNSRLKAYQTCPRLEAYRYRDKIAPLQTTQALNIGRAVHKGLEKWDVGAGLEALDLGYPANQEEADQQEITLAIVHAMLTAYMERYEPFEEHKPELEFCIAAREPFADGFRTSRKIWLCGKIDDIVELDDQQWLVEYKTASQIDKSYIDRLYLDSQITFYMYAANRLGYHPAGIIYRVLRKPLLRRKKNETLPDFTERLTKDYEERPDFYFYETKLYRNNDDLKDFELLLWNEIQQANKQYSKGHVFRHSHACSNYGSCPYLPLCSGELGAENMYTTREPYEELELVKGVQG